MARKSRKNSSQPESAAQIGQVSYVTAIYARLSVENSGKQDEGASLQNQIDVCKEYVAGCPYLRLAEVYADNGKTGTVFDRPAWNRLMDDVRSGKVEAIVVRDLSRFGRDYIEVGNYLEKIFPALGTRFISVKENFDNPYCQQSYPHCPCKWLSTGFLPAAPGRRRFPGFGWSLRASPSWGSAQYWLPHQSDSAHEPGADLHTHHPLFHKAG